MTSSSLLEKIKLNLLTDLDLSNQDLQDTDIYTFAEVIKENVSLTSVNFSGNHISDLGVYYLSDALLNNTTLARIDLSHNKITKKSVKTLRDLAAHKPIIELNLNGNLIPKIGLSSITEIITNRKNETLNLLRGVCTTGEESFWDEVPNNDSLHHAYAVCVKRKNVSELDLDSPDWKDFKEFIEKNREYEMIEIILEYHSSDVEQTKVRIFQWMDKGQFVVFYRNAISCSGKIPIKINAMPDRMCLTLQGENGIQIQLTPDLKARLLPTVQNKDSNFFFGVDVPGKITVEGELDLGGLYLISSGEKGQSDIEIRQKIESKYLLLLKAKQVLQLAPLYCGGQSVEQHKGIFIVEAENTYLCSEVRAYKGIIKTEILETLTLSAEITSGDRCRMVDLLLKDSQEKNQYSMWDHIGLYVSEQKSSLYNSLKSAKENAMNISRYVLQYPASTKEGTSLLSSEKNRLLFHKLEILCGGQFKNSAAITILEEASIFSKTDINNVRDAEIRGTEAKIEIASGINVFNAGLIEANDLAIEAGILVEHAIGSVVRANTFHQYARHMLNNGEMGVPSSYDLVSMTSYGMQAIGGALLYMRPDVRAAKMLLGLGFLVGQSPKASDIFEKRKLGQPVAGETLKLLANCVAGVAAPWAGATHIGVVALKTFTHVVDARKTAYANYRRGLSIGQLSLSGVELFLGRYADFSYISQYLSIAQGGMRVLGNPVLQVGGGLLYAKMSQHENLKQIGYRTTSEAYAQTRVWLNQQLQSMDPQQAEYWLGRLVEFSLSGGFNAGWMPAIENATFAGLGLAQHRGLIQDARIPQAYQAVGLGKWGYHISQLSKEVHKKWQGMKWMLDWLKSGGRRKVSEPEFEQLVHMSQLLNALGTCPAIDMACSEERLRSVNTARNILCNTHASSGETHFSAENIVQGGILRNERVSMETHQSLLINRGASVNAGLSLNLGSKDRGMIDNRGNVSVNHPIMSGETNVNANTVNQFGTLSVKGSLAVGAKEVNIDGFTQCDTLTASAKEHFKSIGQDEKMLIANKVVINSHKIDITGSHTVNKMDINLENDDSTALKHNFEKTKIYDIRLSVRDWDFDQAQNFYGSATINLTGESTGVLQLKGAITTGGTYKVIANGRVVEMNTPEVIHQMGGQFILECDEYRQVSGILNPVYGGSVTAKKGIHIGKPEEIVKPLPGEGTYTFLQANSNAQILTGGHFNLNTDQFSNWGVVYAGGGVDMPLDSELHNLGVMHLGGYSNLGTVYNDLYHETYEYNTGNAWGTAERAVSSQGKISVGGILEATEVKNRGILLGNVQANIQNESLLECDNGYAKENYSYETWRGGLNKVRGKKKTVTEERTVPRYQHIKTHEAVHINNLGAPSMTGDHLNTGKEYFGGLLAEGFEKFENLSNPMASKGGVTVAPEFDNSLGIVDRDKLKALSKVIFDPTLQKALAPPVFIVENGEGAPTQSIHHPEIEILLLQQQLFALYRAGFIDNAVSAGDVRNALILYRQQAYDYARSLEHNQYLPEGSALSLTAEQRMGLTSPGLFYLCYEENGHSYIDTRLCIPSWYINDALREPGAVFIVRSSATLVSDVPESTLHNTGVMDVGGRLTVDVAHVIHERQTIEEVVLLIKNRRTGYIMQTQLCAVPGGLIRAGILDIATDTLLVTGAEIQQMGLGAQEDGQINRPEFSAQIDKTLSSIPVNIRIRKWAKFLPLITTHARQTAVSAKGTNFEIEPEIIAPVISSIISFRAQSEGTFLGQGLQIYSQENVLLSAAQELRLEGVTESYTQATYKEKRKGGGSKESSGTSHVNSSCYISAGQFVVLSSDDKLILKDAHLYARSGKIKAKSIELSAGEGTDHRRTHQSGVKGPAIHNSGMTEKWNTIYPTTITAEGDFYIECENDLFKCGVKLNVQGEVIEHAGFIIEKEPERYHEVKHDKNLVGKLSSVAVTAAISAFVGPAACAAIGLTAGTTSAVLTSAAISGAVQSGLSGGSLKDMIKAATISAMTAAAMSSLSLSATNPKYVKGVAVTNAVVKSAVNNAIRIAINRGGKIDLTTLLSVAIGTLANVSIENEFGQVLSETALKAIVQSALEGGKILELIAQNAAEALGGHLGTQLGEKAAQAIESMKTADEEEIWRKFLDDDEQLDMQKLLAEAAKIPEQGQEYNDEEIKQFSEQEMLETMNLEKVESNLSNEEVVQAAPIHDNATSEPNNSNTKGSGELCDSGKFNAETDSVPAPKSSDNSILDKTFDVLKTVTGALFNGAYADELGSFDHPGTKESDLSDPLNEKRNGMGFMRKMYSYADSLLEEIHHLNNMGEQGLEQIYQEHPKIRENDAEYRAGFNKFRRIVPANADELAVDLALTVGLGAAGPLLKEGQYCYTAYNLHKKGDIKHVFSKVKGQAKSGHLENTFLNKREISKTFVKKENFLGKDKWGNSWYAEIKKDGTQSWVQMRGDVLKSAGRNEIPKPFHPETGLSKPARGKNK